VVSWSWNFGDGNRSSAQSPSHSYAAGGTYTGRLAVTDNAGATDSTSRSVTMIAPNTPPMANDQSVVTKKNTAVNITLTGSDADGDTLTLVVTSGPSHGVLGGIGESQTYTPDTNYTGKDAFTFSVSDGNGGSDTATVSLNVKKGRGGKQRL